MNHRFRQPYSEHAALGALSDTLAVLDELIGPVAGAATRPQGGRVIAIYSAFFMGVDEARSSRDMLRLHVECRAAKGLALDLLVAAEEHVREEVSG